MAVRTEEDGWNHCGCKVKEVKPIETYTCQKCGNEFKSVFDRRIIPQIEPLCPVCIAKYYRRNL
jgi:anaerobic ribonucleoside-triphosphate reductase